MRNDFCSNYLEHSAKGTSWRKKGAKYLSRVWKNGRWVYEYKITGKGYKIDAEMARRESKDYSDFAKNVKKEADSVAGLDKTSRGGTTMRSIYNYNTKQAEYHGRQVAKSESDYKTKSLAGIAESTIKKGQDTIAKLLDSLKPQTTVRITSNLMPANTEKVYKKKK